jgi:putative membrane protein
MGFLLRLIGNSLALWLCALLLDGVRLTEAATTGEQVLVVAVVGLVLTLVHTVVRPVVKLLALPLTILTLGLFTFVINALMILLTSWLTGYLEWGLEVDGFWWALIAGLVVSVVTWLVDALVPGDR